VGSLNQRPLLLPRLPSCPLSRHTEYSVYRALVDGIDTQDSDNDPLHYWQSKLRLPVNLYYRGSSRSSRQRPHTVKADNGSSITIINIKQSKLSECILDIVLGEQFSKCSTEADRNTTVRVGHDPDVPEEDVSACAIMTILIITVSSCIRGVEQ
jgi:hypothetical protein